MFLSARLTWLALRKPKEYIMKEKRQQTACKQVARGGEKLTTN
jgi:hypothetical protein